MSSDRSDFSLARPPTMHGRTFKAAAFGTHVTRQDVPEGIQRESGKKKKKMFPLIFKSSNLIIRGLIKFSTTGGWI